MKTTKPSYTIHACAEKWSSMLPNPDGTRHCDSCNKNLVDFRTMSWKEIIRLQQANNHNLCGVYRRPQVSDNPHSPSFFSSFWVTAASLLLWLTNPRESSASGNGSTYIALPVLQPGTTQPADTTQKKTLTTNKGVVIRGRVIAYQEGGDTSAPIGISGADIGLKGTSLYLTTDSLGYFEVDISDYRFAPGK